MRYIISSAEDGLTVKQILLSNIGVSVSHLRHLKFIENGIMLNGEKATVRRRVATGDCLEVAVEDVREGSRLTPTDIPLEMIYEDLAIAVPSKPANMPTHPSHNHRGDTLADALAYKYQHKDSAFVFRSISRLDKNTSGILLIAKDRISASKLSASMKNCEIEKQYLAILDGELSGEGEIDTYIKRAEESIIFRKVCSENEGGDRAITQYRVLCSKNGYSLVIASPITGRTHQLRVHFAHLGTPILADDLYGKQSELLDRHALHAMSLSFPHPKTQAKQKFFAPPSEDMTTLIHKLFGDTALDCLTEFQNILESKQN